MNARTPLTRPLYDRALLLHGPKRNETLTLDEVRQYGTDSFSDVDYLCIYGLKPAEWYARGIRLLGRTAVECTRDVLADQIGRDIANLIASVSKRTSVTVFDPFAGSCNTLYWILRHVPSSEGLAFEVDRQVFEVTNRNISGLDRRIDLRHGDFLANLASLDLPTGHALVAFVAPPWGRALDEVKGLDLRRTEPPITVIVERIAQRYPDRQLLFATQVYEKIDPASRAELEGTFDWSQLSVYGFNATGHNHGILLGTKGGRRIEHRARNDFRSLHKQWAAVIEPQQEQKPRIASPMRIGIISDTHGLIRPEVTKRLAGVRHVIHAGDIGRPEVISELRKIAPITAIRGNIDRGEWAAEYPHAALVKLGGWSIYVLHNLKEFGIDPTEAGIDVVVSGHSHSRKSKPSAAWSTSIRGALGHAVSVCPLHSRRLS